ncbi:hypothetical protein FKX85_10065 [Echinicola soli]|uniref:Cell surface protein SprA n=1 Tax=Echinicola soli TaxID=2591634 RepID=A0A514CHQ5_9BACT|nr:hypothetical protein [Echinicola soli]QDH79361.1 hypothetical protein FKX85_10065 [Echinicola soli]
MMRSWSAFVPVSLTCLVIIAGMVWSGPALGQSPLCKWLEASPSADSVHVKLDSLTALESSISISGERDYQWIYNSSSGFLTIYRGKNAFPDSLQVCYRRFPYALNRTFSHRTLEADYDSMAYFKKVKEVEGEVYDFREEIFPSGKLNKSGSLTRGISFGNTQNVFVNSALNLQMDGQLTDDLFIRASITDQNVPFQPQGNTQQVQDFDNVLIELYNDHFSLKAGDVVFRQRQSTFLRYYKNVQGLQLTTDYSVNEKWKASTQVGASIAKGKFNSVQLDIREGVLGPYRIPGPENERYIIVMANSERVFLDGKQLKRGFNHDYIIDYNQGQITFTTNVLITQYSRVRIDYEYSERNFSRSILTANHVQESEKATFYVNYYKEQDNRNRPLFDEYAEEDKLLLAAVGDNINAAAVPRVDSVAYDPQRILYRKVTTVNAEGEASQYYEYSTAPDEAHFEVTFTEVGTGRGNYRRQEQLANGFVYEYVPPVNGQPQGNYTHYSILPAPNKKQMMTAGGEVKLSPYEKIYGEGALSNQDINLFSDLGNQDDKGYGLKGGFVSEGRPLGWLKGYQLEAATELEYNSVNFEFIDRQRYIEFDRDWGLSQEALAIPASEKLIMAKAGVRKDAANELAYQLNYRKRGARLEGTQQRAKWYQQIGEKWFTRQDLFLLQSEMPAMTSDWVRYDAEVFYRSKILVPGYQFNVDRNQNMDRVQDSVISSAMNFLSHKFYVRSNDTLPYSFFADVSWREDRFPVEGVMLPDTKAFTTNYGLQKQLGAHDLKGTLTYRRLYQLRGREARESTVMGRLDYISALLDNNLRNELSYAIGNGQELRREFVYLPVPTGEGTHTWRDENEDGVQQLGEFYLAINPEEKNYIRMFTPTDDYIQAYTTLFNYRLNAQFPDQWRKEEGVKKLLGKFSNTTSWNVEKKITAGDFWMRVSPFANAVPPEDLVSLREVFRSTLFFNRTSSSYGADLGVFKSSNKQLLTGGFEENRQENWRMNFRMNVNRLVNLRLKGNVGQTVALSDYLENRNYHVDQMSTGPELTWQPSPIFRTSFQYLFTHKKNVENVEFEETAALHELAAEIRYAKAIKTTVNALVKYTQIDYNGRANSPVGYEMLEALTVGSNISWSINWIQKIGEGLQLNLTYEGRDSEGLERLVHTGRMQVSALF